MQSGEPQETAAGRGAMTVVQVEARNRGIQYSSHGWSFAPYGSAVSHFEGSSLTFHFIGTKLTWVGSVGSEDPAVATYTIDGQVTIPIPDLPAQALPPTLAASHVLFETPALSPGQHNITVVNQRDGSRLSLSYLLVQSGGETIEGPGWTNRREGGFKMGEEIVAAMQHLYRRDDTSPAERISTTAVLAGVLGSFGFFCIIGCIFMLIRRRRLRSERGSRKERKSQGTALKQDMSAKAPFSQIPSPTPPPPAVHPKPEHRERERPTVRASSPAIDSLMAPSPRRTHPRDRRQEIAIQSKSPPRSPPKRVPPPEVPSSSRNDPISSLEYPPRDDTKPTPAGAHLSGEERKISPRKKVPKEESSVPQNKNTRRPRDNVQQSDREDEMTPLRSAAPRQTTGAAGAVPAESRRHRVPQQGDREGESRSRRVKESSSAPQLSSTQVAQQNDQGEEGRPLQQNKAAQPTRAGASGIGQAVDSRRPRGTPQSDREEGGSGGSPPIQESRTAARPTKEPQAVPVSSSRRGDQEDDGRVETPVPLHPPLLEPRTSPLSNPAAGGSSPQSASRVNSQPRRYISGLGGGPGDSSDNEYFSDASTNSRATRQTLMSSISASRATRNQGSFQASAATPASRLQVQQQVVVDLPPAYTPD